jgi:hypothetical protein
MVTHVLCTYNMNIRAYSYNYCIMYAAYATIQYVNVTLDMESECKAYYSHQRSHECKTLWYIWRYSQYSHI